MNGTIRSRVHPLEVGHEMTEVVFFCRTDRTVGEAHEDAFPCRRLTAW
jgi:hypothetical protein